MGSLWGTYDEAANEASFADSLAEWRTAGKEPGALQAKLQGGLDAEAQKAVSLGSKLKAPVVAGGKKNLAGENVRRSAAALCYHCLRQFSSVPVPQTPDVAGKEFCSSACLVTYREAAGLPALPAPKQAAAGGGYSTVGLDVSQLCVSISVNLELCFENRQGARN